MRKYTPENAKLIPTNAECVFKGKIFEVFQWPQKMFDGSFETFEMLRRADTVKIIAIITVEEAHRLGFEVDEPQLIITKQEQPRKEAFYDYPGGRVDIEDVDELAAAKRELLEETGLRFRDWKLIKVTQPLNKIDWLVYTFVATGLLEQVGQSLDTGEKIEVMPTSLTEVKKLAAISGAQYLRLREMNELIDLSALANLPELYKY